MEEGMSCVSIIYMIVTEFSEKLKVVSSDFSITKKIVAPNIFESLPVNLICCGSFNLVYLLKSIAIYVFGNKQNLINYQLYSHYYRSCL